MQRLNKDIKEKMKYDNETDEWIIETLNRFIEKMMLRDPTTIIKASKL